jgi:hypothetical protein
MSRLTTFVPTVQQVSIAISGRGAPFLYGMTQRGAARWEALAEPDWDRYICEEAAPEAEPDISRTSLWARTKVRLEEALLFGYAGEPISSNQERWEPLVPWQATYWKTLPDGYRVELLTRRFSDGVKSTCKEAEMWNATFKWHRYDSEINWSR